MRDMGVYMRLLRYVGIFMFILGVGIHPEAERARDMWDTYFVPQAATFGYTETKQVR